MFVSWDGKRQGKSRSFPIDGDVRRRFRSMGDLLAHLRNGEALNLVLDVLAQLLEDAFDVLGRAVIGECP